MTCYGPQMQRMKKAVVDARHEHVFNAIRDGGVVDVDRIYSAVRRACGATRGEVHTSIDRLRALGRIEVVERGTRGGVKSTYRVTQREGDSR